MRWSNASEVGLVVAVLSNYATLTIAQSAPPGEPTIGATSIPVTDVVASDATNTMQSGGATSFIGRQDPGVTDSYNNGMYTPWTTADQVASAPVVETAVATPSAATDSSVFLEPSTDSLVSSNAVPSNTVSETLPASIIGTDTLLTMSSAVALPTATGSLPASVVTSDTAILSAPIFPPSSSPISSDSSAGVASSSLAVIPSSSLGIITSSSISSISTNSISSSPKVSSATSSARPSSIKATPINDASSTTNKKVGTVLPVTISLGVLSVLFALLLFLVWRRRAAKKRLLNNRRYDDDDVEKGGLQYGQDSSNEKGLGAWTSFGRNSLYENVESGTAGLGVPNKWGYHGGEEHDSSERGWGWGVGSDTYDKAGRGPLPITPAQPNNATMPSSDSSRSLDHHLDAMIAQSRTGYEPHAQKPLHKNSLKRAASAVYSSLSGRGKRFGSRVSSRSSYSNSSDKGQWTEHGAWISALQPGEGEQDAEHLTRNPALLAAVEDAGQTRPLLACVDETPRKARHSTYSPPVSPTRSNTRLQYRGDADDTDATVVGSSSNAMLKSFSDGTSGHMRRYTLRDNSVHLVSPTVAGSPRRHRSKTVSESEYDSPSLYSPSVNTHSECSSQPHFPASLQPRNSPAIGSRPVTPAIQSHPYYVAHNQQKEKSGLTQSTRSGTTYSLGSVAGLMYANESKQTQPSYTALPARKPRRQSQMSKFRPVTGGSPLSNGATAGDYDETNPHRAISRVLKASRARGSSIGSGSSENGGGSTTSWTQQVRHQLRESNSSGSSINDLLQNVLGPARSPA